MKFYSQLPRLNAASYKGETCVLWTYPINKRETGWLTVRFHSIFREVLLHTCIRYKLGVPAYCLMPDHIHWIGLGVHSSTDQQKVSSFLRRFTSPHLSPFQWQRQAHDHVLRKHEREKDGIINASKYLLENPVRAGLVDAFEQWPYLGCMVPGYPELNPLQEHYFEVFWQGIAWFKQNGGT